MPKVFRRRPAGGRRRGVRPLILLAAFLLAGALLDPAIIPPFGPLATAPEEVSARFARCGRGSPSNACVIDGDTFRLGTRRVRLVGVDAPELQGSRCPTERALGEKAADRLTVLLNQGPVHMAAHRFKSRDRFGRDLLVVRNRSGSVGDVLRAEGLAHRYMGVKRNWC